MGLRNVMVTTVMVGERQRQLRLVVGERVCSRERQEMTEMVWFTIVARPLYFVREYAIHVWYDFLPAYLRGVR